ncbi:hypothetical protein YC2023_076181 [Brassica napus]
MSNKLLSELSLDHYPIFLWVPTAPMAKVGFKTLYLSLDLDLDLEQETRGMGSEHIWNKGTRERRDLVTTTNRLQPPPPPYGTGEEERERRERRREKRKREA